ncbi:toxin AnmTx Cj 1c-1-like [Tubulanus polymorphus]|uniref:toxin AnmTx Cj 1c-1-like n=1 Tax=Tubulanus polymorphus TaxID=672921 RepID=UPI003DA5953E
MKVFILIVIVAVVIAGVAAKDISEELVHERFRRTACACFGDPKGTFAGTIFYFVGCHKSGWSKCGISGLVFTCCKKG